MLRHQLLGTS